MSLPGDLTDIIRSDPVRWAALGHVRALDLPDCWIGAGFVREAVWDRLHGLPLAAPHGDVDVIWFDRAKTNAEIDRRAERGLLARNRSLRWSVKNQARMHLKNGDEPYTSSANAMTFWPETATAVAVRRTDGDLLEINAPLRLEDLFAMRLVPTAMFEFERRAIFEQRVHEKAWLKRYPLLKVAPAEPRDDQP